MAIICKLTKAQQRRRDKQLAAAPVAVRKAYEACPPTKLYLLKTSGHRVTIESYQSDGTVTVAVTGQYNRVAFDRNVFGINPEDLEECDLPAPDEHLGARLTQDELDDHIDEIRVQTRPDLWAMGPDGKAVWKQTH
jgi:hypothetical protein